MAQAAVLVPPPNQRLLSNPQLLTIIATVAPLSLHLLRQPQLRDDLLCRVLLALGHQAPFL